MLTEKEFQQIEWAIKAMNGYTVNDKQLVFVDNVLGLLKTYIDKKIIKED